MLVDVPGGSEALPEPEVMPVPIVTEPALRLMSVQANPEPILEKLAVSVIGWLAISSRSLCALPSSTVLAVSSTTLLFSVGILACR